MANKQVENTNTNGRDKVFLLITSVHIKGHAVNDVENSNSLSVCMRWCYLHVRYPTYQNLPHRSQISRCPASSARQKKDRGCIIDRYACEGSLAHADGCVGVIYVSVKATRFEEEAFVQFYGTNIFGIF